MVWNKGDIFVMVYGVVFRERSPNAAEIETNRHGAKYWSLCYTLHGEQAMAIRQELTLIGWKNNGLKNNLWLQ